MSSQILQLFHPGGGCGHPPGQPASAGSTPTFSGLLFPPRRCGSGGRGGGRFFLELAEKNEGAERLLKLQNQLGGRIPFQDVLKQNSGRVGKTQDNMEAALALERNPDPGPLGATGPGSTRTDPPTSDFLQNHFRGEEVKLIKKMGDTRLTSTGCQPRLGWASLSSKCSPSSTTRSLWSQRPWRGPSASPGVWLFPEPLPQTISHSFNYPEALCHALDQMKQ